MNVPKKTFSSWTNFFSDICELLFRNKTLFCDCFEFHLIMKKFGMKKKLGKTLNCFCFQNFKTKVYIFAYFQFFSCFSSPILVMDAFPMRFCAFSESEKFFFNSSFRFFLPSFKQNKLFQKKFFSMYSITHF